MVQGQIDVVNIDEPVMLANLPHTNAFLLIGTGCYLDHGYTICHWKQ